MNPIDPNANPYAAPRAPHAHLPYAAPQPPGSYTRREGDALVHTLGANLPAVCMKCGRPDGLVPRNHTFQYTPPWTVLFFVLCNLVGIIAMLIMRKQAKMVLPLCQPCNERWRKAMIALWAALGVMFVPFVLGLVLASASETAAGVLLSLAGIGFVALMVVSFALVRPALLRTKKIDATHIWILGVHRQVLDQLPQS
ncbi:hypothetical protein [Pendulispora albinea]|uniref:DUF983 domain-containing protein n=1 Tax=Pendulispora albinea TaxID=2741071 RepID=A0ABZ2M7D9_9BACT